MERLTLNVSDTDELKKATLEALTNDKGFYKLVLELSDRTDNDAGSIEPADLLQVEGYLNKYATYYYYTAELLYMVQFAMEDVTMD